MKDILEGTTKLLTESINLIGDSLLEKVIFVGGWGPYLRHQDVHPGTKDVDILFPMNYSPKEIEKVIENFLQNSFYISAKHDFQLCRAYEIGERTYIFNVDLLHPTEGKVQKIDFIDIMNLDVTVDGVKVKTVLTINILHGDLIHSEQLVDKINFSGKIINVLDGAGIVISKLSACHNKKRPRDIFDIYLSLKEPNTIEKVKYLSTISYSINEELENYRALLKKNWADYEASLRLFKVEDPNALKFLLIE
ncbi:hypothetical protein EYY60_03700 [Flavobacterium zhairuonense]|uniref:nucleotidyl transferase AbiEii/AbiGii toxin family protein n=1 Tax=Flavobacterium zhairuonense TaxID=2493631 RepID=UPI0010471E14|nr:nucleotidyl transferase AbiEii/AbiGii toxin family protein [Flavobacterium zhairuonense]KAF2514370.1 hypothetical protein EYY60_03700 [Flavobacterium zhairuonense]